MTPRRTPINRYPNVLPILQSISPDAVAEFKFHDVRRWRADFAIPSAKILIEIDGGVFSGGRHTRGAGFIGDQTKHNAAAILGYFVLRFVPADIRSGELFKIVREVHGNTQK